MTTADIDLARGMIAAGEPHRSYGFERLTKLAKGGSVQAGIALAEEMAEHSDPNTIEQAEAWVVAVAELGHAGPLRKLIGLERQRGASLRVERLEARLAAISRPSPSPPSPAQPDTGGGKGAAKPPAADGSTKNTAHVEGSRGLLSTTFFVFLSFTGITGALFTSGLYMTRPEVLRDTWERLRDPDYLLAFVLPDPYQPHSLVDLTPENGLQPAPFPAASASATAANADLAIGFARAADEAASRGQYDEARDKMVFAVEAAFSAGDLDLVERLLANTDTISEQAKRVTSAWEALRREMSYGISYEVQIFDGWRKNTRQEHIGWSVSQSEKGACLLDVARNGGNRGNYFQSTPLARRVTINVRSLSMSRPQWIDLRDDAFRGGGATYERLRAVCDGCPEYMIETNGFAMTFYSRSDAERFLDNVRDYIRLNNC